MAGLSDLAKSKKSTNLTMQFNGAASMKSKWNNEYKVKYDTMLQEMQIKSSRLKAVYRTQQV
jgi:hypothetical protein